MNQPETDPPIQPETCHVTSMVELEAALAGMLADQAAEERLSAHLGQCPLCQSRMHLLLEKASHASLDDGSTLDEPDPAADSIMARLKMADPVMEDYKPGDQIGQYRVMGLIGRGGSSAVYECTDPQMARRVAVKVLTHQTFLGTLAARHEREARMLARLDHPWIVKAYEIRPLDVPPYIVMELVAGGSSRRLIRSGPLNPRLAARLVAGVADALQHAHEQGVLHRDIKPSNLLVVQPLEGFQPPPDNLALKISDFGLARLLDGESSLTSTNAIIGTPAYMSPEQARGNQAEIGPASDIYSLGTVLYEYLVGRPPLLADTTVATLRMINEVEPIAPRHIQPGIPLDLDTICMKCLRKSAEERYATAGELADDLQRFLEGRPILARPLGRFQRVYRWCRRNPLPAVLMSGIVVLGLSLVALAVTFAIVQKDLRQQAEAAAQAAYNEGEFTRNLFTAGIGNLDNYVAKVRQVKKVEELSEITEKAKARNEWILEQYFKHIQKADMLHGESIDKIFRDGIAFKQLGYMANAKQIFQQLITLAKSLAPRHPDYAQARRVALQSATILAIDQLASGQSAEAARFLNDLRRSLGMDYGTRNQSFMDLIVSIGLLDIEIKALRQSNQPAEADRLEALRPPLRAAITAAPDNPRIAR